MKRRYLAIAVVLGASPAVAQTPLDEITQLRAMLRQQALAMQSMQRRLAAIEARNRAPAVSQPTQQVGQVSPLPPTGNGRDLPRQPSSRYVGIKPAVPEGLTGLTGQPTPAGTVEASPRQEAAENKVSISPATGNPPLPVLSANDRVQVVLSGQVNRSITSFSDGSGRTDTYFTDNNVSSTRLRVLGSARLAPTTLAVSAIEFDLRSNSSASVSRQTANNDGGDTPILGPFRIRRAEVGLQSSYGSLLLGRGSTFTDGIAEFDLSGTDVAFYSFLPDSGGSLQFSNSAGVRRRPGDPSISQVFDDFDGPRDDRLRYDTPIWHGASLGGSVAQGGFADVGLRYAGDIGGVKIASGIGYMNYQGTLPSTQTQDGTDQATTPFKQRVAGSVAVLLPNGFNFLASAGWGEHYAGCCGTGTVAHDPSRTYFLKGGYQARIFSFGPSNFAVEGGQTFNRIQDGDTASRYGVSFNQQVIAKGFEVYAGYEHLTLNRAGTVRLAPADLALIGSRIQF